MKKLFFILLLIVCVAAGVWVYDSGNMSIFGIASNDADSSKIPNLSNLNDKISQAKPSIEPADTVIPTQPTEIIVAPAANVAAPVPVVTATVLPKKSMIKKIDPSSLGNVPSFNLKDLYSSIDDPKISGDSDLLAKSVDKFVADYRGKVGKLNAAKFLQSIKEFETINMLSYKITEMASLTRDLDLSDKKVSKFYSKIEQQNADIQSKLAFFMLEIIKLPDVQLNKMYKDKKAGEILKYKPFIDQVRQFTKYALSEDLEKMSIQKNITANEAWSKLYNNTLSTISFDVQGEKYTIQQATPLIFHKDPEVRRLVADEIGKALKNNSMAITMSINSIIKDKRLEDKMRGYGKPISQRNLYNGVKDEVVDSLIKTVKSNYKQTLQRYYKIKAKILGLEKLKYSDRLAPMPFDADDEKVYLWDEARSIVLDSYKQFSPKMSVMAAKFFDNNWIDAKIMPNKVVGAYCDLGIPTNHPYIMMTYTGQKRDVMTIAHEVGHGIHALLSYSNGFLMMNPGLTVAETASLLGERITFDNLLSKAQNNKQKLALMAKKIEDSLNASIIAIAIADFENKLHDAAGQSGELSADDINNIWVSCLTEAYGDSVELGEYDAYRWASIGHIFSAPFYYYAYAFSQLTVDSLYSVYQSNNISDFEGKVVMALSAGGTKKHQELMSVFGLDSTKADFWQNGINGIIKVIDNFESLVNADPDIQQMIKKAKDSQVIVADPAASMSGAVMVSEGSAQPAAVVTSAAMNNVGNDTIPDKSSIAASVNVATDQKPSGLGKMPDNTMVSKNTNSIK